MLFQIVGIFFETYFGYLGIYFRLGGGFKYFLFSSLLGEDSHFDLRILFQMGGEKPPTSRSFPGRFFSIYI